MNLLPNPVSQKASLAPLVLILTLVLNLVSTLSAASSEPLEVEMNEFFEKKLESFHNMSKSKYLRSKKLRTSENYLRQILKKQQPFYSILRVNTRGVVANEVTRQESEPEEKYRTIADQKGFIKVVKTQKPYYGVIKNSRGRNYLMWIDPLFNSKKKFVGAVIAKVDIWDCIHEFSQDTDIHFLVKMGKKSLYSHKWKNPRGARKRPLDVPGASNLSILYKLPSTRSETDEWQTVKDTFTTMKENEKQVAAETGKKAQEPAKKTATSNPDPLSSPKAEKLPTVKKEPQEASLSQGKKILIIVIIIGLITLILAVFMIKKANKERDSIL